MQNNNVYLEILINFLTESTLCLNLLSSLAQHVSGRLLILIGHLDLSGTPLRVAPSMDTKKACVQKRLDYVLKTL